VKFEFIQAQKAHFPVEFLCEQLGVSRSGFYAWSRRPASARQEEDQKLAAEVAQAHRDSRGVYGSPRVHAQLRAQGRRVSRKRVARLMEQQKLAARRRRRRVCTTDSKHGLPVAPNVLNRNFCPAAPNRTWATDITYVWTAEGWLYLAVVLDLFSRKVVGWAMGEHIDRHLVLSGLEMALASRGIECSMSRKGNCWDNAVVESFFSSLKQELVYRTDFATRQQARSALFEYIEVFYNRQRRHSTLGYVSPVDFENAALPVTLAA
jgi:putative transposase